MSVASKFVWNGDPVLGATLKRLAEAIDRRDEPANLPVRHGELEALIDSRLRQLGLLPPAAEDEGSVVPPVYRGVLA